MAVKAKAKRKNKKLNKKNKFIIALSVVLVFALAIGGSALVFRGREKVYYEFCKNSFKHGVSFDVARFSRFIKVLISFGRCVEVYSSCVVKCLYRHNANRNNKHTHKSEQF